MNALQQLEKTLAELLGWTNLEYYEWPIDKLTGTPPDKRGETWHLPRWTADDAAAFQLIVEHDVDVNHWEDWAVNTYINFNAQGNLCEYKDYASKAEALRVSIVASVIMKLKEIK